MYINKITIDHAQFPTKKAYPFNLSILRNTNILDLKTPVTIFAGENGTGKSTLLKAICLKCNIHIWEGIEGSEKIWLTTSVKSFQFRMQA